MSLGNTTLWWDTVTKVAPSMSLCLTINFVNSMISKPTLVSF